MLKKINLVKDIASKIGRKKANEIFSMIENDAPFVVEVKIKKSNVKNSKEVISLNKKQEIILEFIDIAK